jgi:hypothetical protein
VHVSTYRNGCPLYVNTSVGHRARGRRNTITCVLSLCEPGMHAHCCCTFDHQPTNYQQTTSTQAGVLKANSASRSRDAPDTQSEGPPLPLLPPATLTRLRAEQPSRLQAAQRAHPAVAYWAGLHRHSMCCLAPRCGAGCRCCWALCRFESARQGPDRILYSAFLAVTLSLLEGIQAVEHGTQDGR